MTAHGNHLLLFVMRSQPSLKKPLYSHTRGLSFIRRPLLLSPTWQREINSSPLTHLYLTLLATLIVARGWEPLQAKDREMTRERKKYKRNYCEWCSIVSTWPKLKTNMRYVTKSSGLGSSPGYPLDPVSPPKLLFSSTQWRRQQTQKVSVCVGPGLSPLNSVSPLTSTQVPQVLRIGPVLFPERYHDIGLQWPQTQTVIVADSHKQAYKTHAHTHLA